MNKELVLWAKYDVERAIPSVVDGLMLGSEASLDSIFDDFGSKNPANS